MIWSCWSSGWEGIWKEKELWWIRSKCMEWNSQGINPNNLFNLKRQKIKMRALCTMMDRMFPFVCPSQHCTVYMWMVCLCAAVDTSKRNYNDTLIMTKWLSACLTSSFSSSNSFFFQVSVSRHELLLWLLTVIISQELLLLLDSILKTMGWFPLSTMLFLIHIQELCS